MKIYGISDIHLGLGINKTMDKFGKAWVNHTKRLENNWNKKVCDDDYVLIPGDISWAKNLKEAYLDLEFLDSLKGRKILMNGNHDYWWSSVSKLNSLYPSIKFIKNTFFPINNIAVCGTRGWINPNSEFYTLDDEKIFNREKIRLRLSLDSAKNMGYNDFLIMFHFPPFNDKGEEGELISIIKDYNVKNVIYGHLHGEESFLYAKEGIVGGINYKLVSADYVNFEPYWLGI